MKCCENEMEQIEYLGEGVTIWWCRNCGTLCRDYNDPGEEDWYIPDGK